MENLMMAWQLNLLVYLGRLENQKNPLYKLNVVVFDGLQLGAVQQEDSPNLANPSLYTPNLANQAKLSPCFPPLCFVHTSQSLLTSV